MLGIFDLINILNPDISPTNSKIHLANWNGEENPLDVYFMGEFEEWQRWQTRRNFERKFVISLISMPRLDHWLFAGVHISKKPEWYDDSKLYKYDLIEDKLCHELNGRLIVSFRRPGRQSYLNSENWASQILVNEILPEKLFIGEFPGYKAINLTHDELKLIVRQSLESWRTALSNVAGVYLISDTLSGKLYIGSASGEGGIWQRWVDYANDGHGGNVELRKILGESDINRVKSFQYSVLEIADIHASHDDIIKRESHWKNILMTRKYGLNAN